MSRLKTAGKVQWSKAGAGKVTSVVHEEGKAWIQDALGKS